MTATDTRLHHGCIIIEPPPAGGENRDLVVTDDDVRPTEAQPTDTRRSDALRELGQRASSRLGRSNFGGERLVDSTPIGGGAVGHFRGHDVVDSARRLIGTISDVVYDESGDPQWAVVDLGLLRSAHYLPVSSGRMSRQGEFVVPYDKTTVKAAPQADRRHVVGPVLSRQLSEHYHLT